MKKLEVASDVVCILTPRSLGRPWILYEAGVAKGKLGTPVLGIAFGMPLSKASSGPFAQFHNCADDEESLTKLVLQLLRRIPGAEPDPDAIKMQVEQFKKKADILLAQLEADSQDGDIVESEDETQVTKLFEEVKLMFQELPTRIEGRINDGVDLGRRKRSRKLSPMFLEEMVLMPEGIGHDPTVFLILGSMFKDDIPPIYELCLDVYRAMTGTSSREYLSALNRLTRFYKSIRRGPILEYYAHTEDTYILFKELQHILEIINTSGPRPQQIRGKTIETEDDVDPR